MVTQRTVLHTTDRDNLDITKAVRLDALSFYGGNAIRRYAGRDCAVRYPLILAIIRHARDVPAREQIMEPTMNCEKHI